MEPALAQLEERYSGVKLAILDALAALRSDDSIIILIHSPKMQFG